MGEQQLAYGVVEACRVAACGRSTLYREIRAGRLRARKIRGRTVILVDDLKKWLQALPTRSA